MTDTTRVTEGMRVTEGEVSVDVMWSKRYEMWNNQ